MYIQWTMEATNHQVHAKESEMGRKSETYMLHHLLALRLRKFGWVYKQCSLTPLLR